MRFNHMVISLALTALVSVSCSGGKPHDAKACDTQTAVQAATPSAPETDIAPLSRDVEFMIFLHRFTSDPDFQMDHIRFPLGKMSYAYLPDQELYDSFTSKYWYLQSIESLRDHFTWKNDNRIVYLFNNSMIDAEDAPEFQETYTFEKIDGQWYVTKGDYSSSDVGLARNTAQEVRDANAQYRKNTLILPLNTPIRAPRATIPTHQSACSPKRTFPAFRKPNSALCATKSWPVMATPSNPPT